jgi:hypothetical protein
MNRAICLSCTTRRMHDTAAHLVARVIPRVPVRQWVVTFAPRVRYHLAADPTSPSSSTSAGSGCSTAVTASNGDSRPVPPCEPLGYRHPDIPEEPRRSRVGEAEPPSSYERVVVPRPLLDRAWGRSWNMGPVPPPPLRTRRLPRDPAILLA